MFPSAARCGARDLDGYWDILFSIRMSIAESMHGLLSSGLRTSNARIALLLNTRSLGYKQLVLVEIEKHSIKIYFSIQIRIEITISLP
jgi:hypothetical protein